MASPEKRSFSIGNEIQNAPQGDNNTSAVTSNYGGNQFHAPVVILQHQQIVALQDTSIDAVTSPKVQEDENNLFDAPLVDIVARDEWGAKQPFSPMKKLKKTVKTLVICHTLTDNTDDAFLNRQIIRQMQINHFGAGLGDISFNFMIGGDGEVYEGRGFDFVGAHTESSNAITLGIGFLGDFRTIAPSSISIENCKKLLEVGVKAGHIAPNYQVKGHSEIEPNESPGKMLLDELHRLKPKVAELENL